MPVDVIFSEDGKRADVLYIGFVTGKEIFEACNVVYEPERLATLQVMLGDASLATGADLTTREIRLMSHQDSLAFELNPHLAIASLVSSDLVYGLARMWESYLVDSQFKVNIFRDRDEAERWLREHQEYLGKMRESITSETNA